MSLAVNLGDLERHARDFARRTGFTFPANDSGGGAQVRSWARADVAELDRPLHAAVARWLVERWPFECAIYADRP